MVTIRVAVPATYVDGPDGRAQLVWQVGRVHPDLDLQVVDLIRDGDSVVAVLDDEGQGPVTVPVPVADDVWGQGAAGARRLDEHLQRLGLTLATFDPVGRTATAVRAELYEVASLRPAAARALGCAGEPWRVDVRSRWVPGRLDAVTVAARDSGVDVSRAPGLLAELPAYRGVYEVTESRFARTVTFAWRPRPELPETVALEGLLPDRLAPDGWHSLPLGVDPDGATVGIDLLAGPHTLVVGPTGSGKTVALVTLVAGALARGHELVVVDPTKGGLDFLALRPWCAAWADTLEGARDVLKAVYAEVGRRKAVLQREGEVKWSDLPASVREAERIRPLTVLVDEASSLFIAPDTKVTNALPKESEEREELVEQAAAKALVKLLVGKLAREARFVGIHLQVATQRPDADILGGELRSNLTSAVQLTKPGAVPSTSALGMVFSAEQVPEAVRVLGELDDGSSRGLAAVAAEGGTVQGLRVGYAPMREVAELLVARGVPHAVPLPVPTAPEPEPAAPTVLVVHTEEVTDESELGWDDLLALGLEPPPDAA